MAAAWLLVWKYISGLVFTPFSALFSPPLPRTVLSPICFLALPLLFTLSPSLRVFTKVLIHAGRGENPLRSGSSSPPTLSLGACVPRDSLHFLHRYPGPGHKTLECGRTRQEIEWEFDLTAECIGESQIKHNGTKLRSCFSSNLTPVFWLRCSSAIWATSKNFVKERSPYNTAYVADTTEGRKKMLSWVWKRCVQWKLILVLGAVSKSTKTV